MALFPNGFMPAIQNNSNTLLMTGLGLLSGPTAQQQAALGAQGFMQGRQASMDAKKLNQTVQWLKTVNPQLAQAVEMGALSPADAYKTHLKLTAQMPGDVSYSKSPVFGQNDKGETVIGTIGDDGSFKQIDTGGFRVSDGLDKIDTGTEIITRDRRTGQVLSVTPKQNYQESYDKAAGNAVGTFEGGQNATAQKDVASADMALDLLTQIEKDPGLDWGVGGTSIFNGIPGTPGHDFQNLVNQATSTAFLQAVQQMRGLGSLSNAEGSAATAAVTRMRTSTSKEAFLKALSDYRTLIELGRQRALARVPGNAAPNAGGSSDASDPLGIR